MIGRKSKNYTPSSCEKPKKKKKNSKSRLKSKNIWIKIRAEKKRKRNVVITDLKKERMKNAKKKAMN